MNSEVYGIVKIDEQNRITLPEGARAASLTC